MHTLGGSVRDNLISTSHNMSRVRTWHRVWWLFRKEHAWGTLGLMKIRVSFSWKSFHAQSLYADEYGFFCFFLKIWINHQSYFRYDLFCRKEIAERVANRGFGTGMRDWTIFFFLFRNLSSIDTKIIRKMVLGCVFRIRRLSCFIRYRFPKARLRL